MSPIQSGGAHTGKCQLDSEELLQNAPQTIEKQRLSWAHVHV